ncbi:hypothetical protein CR513_41835, partial [Mucuna pruriens]
MYDPIEKKLVRSYDVQFMKDQTIEEINKVKKSTLEKDNNGFDIPLDNDAEEEQELSQDKNLGDAPKLPPLQLRRSNRERQSSTRYTSNEYVTLTNGEEPECY